MAGWDLVRSDNRQNYHSYGILQTFYHTNSGVNAKIGCLRTCYALLFGFRHRLRNFLVGKQGFFACRFTAVTYPGWG